MTVDSPAIQQPNLQTRKDLTVKQQMRVALGQHSAPTHDYLTFAKQLGVGGVQFNNIGKGIDLIPEESDLPDYKGYWEVADLKRLKQRVNDYELELEALENVPRHFYIDAMLNGPRCAEQTRNYQTTVRNMGEARHPDPRVELDAEPGLANADAARARRRQSDRIRHGPSDGGRSGRRHYHRAGSGRPGLQRR